MDNIKGFKVGMLNIRSLWPHIDELRHHFGGFDVLGICETWLNPSMTSQMVSLHGHKMFRLDRTMDKRGGGIAIYVNDRLFEYSCVIGKYCSSNADIEQLWISIKEPDCRNKIIGLVYRPPAGNVETCLSDVRANLDDIHDSENAEITVMGDLNVNYKNRNSSHFKLLKEIERDFGLKQLINDPTRVTPKSSTLIDLILTDCVHVIAAGVLDISISDHLPIYYVKKKPRECNPKKVTYGRSYKRYIAEDYQKDIIDDVKWEMFWRMEGDVNKLWDIMLDIIVTHANKHSPVVKMVVNESCPYWYSKDLIEEITHKNNLFRRAKTTQLDEDWITFQCQKNLVKRLIFSSKESYINEQIDANLNDSRKLWKNVYALSGLGKDKTASGMKDIKNDEGVLIKDQEAADFMNNFYISAGPNLTNHIPKTWEESDFKINIDTTFDFKPITVEEVKKLIDKIDLSKSSAMGNLSTRLLRDAFKCLTLELTYIYNVSLDTGVFPADWGIGLVTPIPKTSSNSKNAKDWRPITQISLPGKLLERIIHTQLSAYLEDNNILYSNQHGFRSQHSTTSAVFSALKHVYENWNENRISTCIFIDFSRAFDSIDHNIFLRKLKLYGMSEKCITFLSSYIDSRTQCTKINGYTSPNAKLECGTAQGSILGPLFFILYVNDIFKYVINNERLTMYADDTLLVEQGETQELSISACQEAMSEVYAWCVLNRLTINIDKTKYMIVSQNSKDVDNPPPITIANTPLQYVHKYEYLGVLLDDKLNMNGHIEHVVKKVQAKLCVLRKFRRHISENTALRLYKTLIMCHMDYGDFLIDFGTKINIDKLDRLQVRTIRCIENCLNMDKRCDLSDLYNRYNLEPLDMRRKRNLLKLMYNESKQDVNIDMYRPRMELRSSKNVKMNRKFTRLSKIQKSPYYRGLSLWDKLPKELQLVESRQEFKCRIRSHVLIS